MTYNTRNIPKNTKAHNARMRHFVSYAVLTSLVWGNIAQAGKDFMDAQKEDAPLVRTVRPSRHSNTKEADHLFFHLDDKSIELSGSDGQKNPISKVNVDRPIREAMAHSQEALDAFLKHNSFSVKEVDNGVLVLHVNGEIKGGMFGGGTGFSGSSFRGSGNFRGGGINWDFRTPSGGGGIIVYPNSTTRELGIGQGGTYGNTTSSMPPIKRPPISGPSNLGPSQRAPLKSRGPIPDKEEKPKTVTQPKEDTGKLKKDFAPIYGEYDHAEILKHKINTSTWDDANTYAKEYGFSKEQYGYIKDHRTGFAFESYMKATNGFYQEYDLAQQVRTLINTKKWDDVYKFSDQMGVSRETVAYINKNRGMLDFNDYMLKTNPTYASFNHATTIQKLINTDTWHNVYAYADKNGITKQQVKEIYKRRSENLSTTQMTKNIKGEVAYDDPLMPNGLVYPVKQTKDMDADAFLPAGYKVSLQDQSLGEALIRGFAKNVDALFCATIGACDANASPARLALEVVKHGPSVINMTDQAWKWTAVTLGLGAKTLYEKHLLKQEHYDAVDFIEKRILLSPTSDFDTNIRILESFGKGVFDNKIALGHAGKLFNEAKDPTEEDKNLEIVDAVGGQHIDPDHEPGDHKKDKGETFHEKAHKDIKQYADKTLETDKVLNKATEFLGKGYKDMGNGRFLSADRLRQVRMMDADILGKHAGGRHMNFEVFKKDVLNPSRMKRITNVHIFLK